MEEDTAEHDDWRVQLNNHMSTKRNIHCHCETSKVSNPTVRITYLLDDHNTTLEHQQAVQQSNSTHYLLNDHNTTLEHQQAVIAQNSY